MARLYLSLSVLLVFSLTPVCTTAASCGDALSQVPPGSCMASALIRIVSNISGGGEETVSEYDVARNRDKSYDSGSNVFHSKKTPQHEGKRRHQLSHLISSVCESADTSQESLDLRELILTRTNEYLEEAVDESRLHHPKKLLHSVASRIPAIKHSPDSRLKITSARPDVDAGVAAFAIGAVARACEVYQNKAPKQEEPKNDASSDIVSDRRFEQLVECVLCGVDLDNTKQRQKQILPPASAQTAITESDNGGNEVEVVIASDPGSTGDEILQYSKGLSVRDTCRAAWGIALLVRHGEGINNIGGENIRDIIVALSERSRDLLIARLQWLRSSAHVDAPSRNDVHEFARVLAQDVACAMWSFACVDACTGIKSYPLLQECCSILCQTPQLQQDLDAGLDDSSNFEVNDVLERLEKSEENSTYRENESQDAMTDVLLDSLSPNELTDVLWSIALHGTTVEDAIGTPPPESTSVLREQGRELSENVAALREVAFDRLVGWLRRDLAVLSSVSEHNVTRSSEQDFLAEDESCASVQATTPPYSDTFVEVVDAESLLAAGNEETSTNNTRVQVKEWTPNDGLGLQQAEQFEAIDAASLLGLSTNNEVDAIEAGGTSKLSRMPVEVDVINNWDSNGEHVEESHSPPDSSAEQYLVTQIFAGMPSQSVKDLPGFDKSNLVWAIARCSKWKPYANDTVKAPAKGRDTPSLRVAYWVAESCLIPSQQEDSGDDSSFSYFSNLLSIFRPPELSRLMWSMACITRSHEGRGEVIDAAMSELSYAALCSAGNKLSIFTTEDLARIGWAFLELYDTGNLKSNSLASESLGRIVATLETSLLRWESGQCSSEEKTQPRHGKRHTTFFGKPKFSRFFRPILEQRLGGVDEEEDGDEDSDSFPVTQSTGLPLLRDLTIDPSTLCKFASGFCKYCQRHDDARGVWTVVRVAVRLLTSKNGQLLRQCSIHDIVHLCSACARFRECRYDRELILRVVSRRTIQLLNESFEAQRIANATAAPLLEAAAPWELCLLYWSLGKLGVRHCKSDQNTMLAYRKLRLVSDTPFLAADQLQDLSVESLVQLLEGMASMESILNDRAFLHEVLKMLHFKVSTVSQCSDLCQVTESVAKALRSIAPPGQLEFSKEASHAQEDPISPAYVWHETLQDQGNETGTDLVEDLTQVAIEGTNEGSETRYICHALLCAVAETAMGRLSDCSASEMRRLLVVYSVLPLQMDNIVDLMEKQITSRLTALRLTSSASSSESTKMLVQNAADAAVEAANTMPQGDIYSTDASSHHSTKSGIKSMFSSSQKTGKPHDESVRMVEPVPTKNSDSITANLIRRSAAAACEAVARFDRLERGVGISAGTLFSDAEEVAAFELGRCQELVASYRRIDFGTGTRQSRYDKKGSSIIGEPVLTRLLPFDE